MNAVPRIIVFSAVAIAAGLRAAPSDSDQIRAIYDEALTHSPAYDKLRELTTRFSGRLAGSANLEGALAWAEGKLRKIGCDDVRTQPVMVPHWDRGEGEESATLLAADGTGTVPIPLTAVGLGGSVATPDGGIRAKVIEVQSLDEVRKLGRDRVAGKIVFYNRPMTANAVRPFEAYGATGYQRNRGPAEASKFGAAAVLVRSLTFRTDDVPHTGVTVFPPEVTRIPAAALSTLAADRLSAALKQNPETQVALSLHGRWLPDAPSHNVIAEIRGSEFPNEIILVGGHLDSWDIAPGAHDDGAGVVQSMEVLRIFRALGIHPKHTLRCVLFVAEENSLAGALEYARVAKEKNEKHIFALESDNGGFQPHGFTIGHVPSRARTRDALA